jgi:hypothetical protein
MPVSARRSQRPVESGAAAMEVPADRQYVLALTDAPYRAFNLIGLQDIGSSGFEFCGAAFGFLNGRVYALLSGAALQFGKIGGEKLQPAFAAGQCVVHPSILSRSIERREGNVFIGPSYRASPYSLDARHG